MKIFSFATADITLSSASVSEVVAKSAHAFDVTSRAKPPESGAS